MNLLLVPYLIITWCAGWVVLKRWFNGLPTLLTAVGAFLFGIGMGVPATYVLTVLFAKTNDPILWGTAVSVILAFLLVFFGRHKISNLKQKKFRPGDIVLAVLALGFSTWLMTKTFHGDLNGLLFVGSNNIFDSAYLVGLVRSVSWGANIPFTSPYFSGLPLFYHFFFVFWAALNEHLGVPIVWAVNMPSILSFTALLIIVYYLPQLVGKQKSAVGWLAVLFTVTNSSLTFWYMKNIKDVWRLGTYPFAGPFDGSVISIFVTLNNYVNQRHLAFAVAFGLFLYILAAKFISEKGMTMGKSVVLGIAVGILFLWNMAIFLLVLAVLCMLFALYKKWKEAAVLITGSVTLAILSVAAVAPNINRAATFINSAFIKSSYGSYGNIPSWNIGTYLWQNLGILPVVVALGYQVIAKKMRTFFVPFLISFIGMCVLASIGSRGFDQKLLSFLIIGVNVLAALAVWWLWVRWKIIATLVVIIITVSGLVDLMPVKNEFAYPLIDKETAAVITWIDSATPKNSVFVSYSDMIDPVVMAGRTNYFGYYGNVGWFDRSASVSKIYGGDNVEAKIHNISYVLVPKWHKNDFPYAIELDKLRVSYAVAYEDDMFIIFKI